MSHMCIFMFISDYFLKIHVKIQPWNKGLTFPIFISHSSDCEVPFGLAEWVGCAGPHLDWTALLGGL